MKTDMNRRSFLKKSIGGLVGSSLAAGATSLALNDETWTPMFWESPEEVLNPEATEGILMLNSWTQENFNWERDPSFGLYDITRPIEWIVENGRGDCTDYTALALSWMIKEGHEDIYMVLVIDPRREGWGGHLAASTGTMVYDLGQTYKLEDLEDNNLIVETKKIDLDKVDY